MKNKYLIILLSFFLIGCTKIDINKETFVREIDNKLNNMLEISEQELNNYYEINTDNFIDFVFKVSKDEPTNIYVLVLPKDKKEAKKDIDNFFDKLAKNCSKECQKRIKNNYSNNYGDYLFYIVSDNSKNIYKEMKEFIKNEQK